MVATADRQVASICCFFAFCGILIIVQWTSLQNATSQEKLMENRRLGEDLTAELGDYLTQKE